MTDTVCVAIGGGGLIAIAGAANAAPRLLHARSRFALSVAACVAIVAAIVAQGAPTGEMAIDALLRAGLALAFLLAFVHAGPRARGLSAAILAATVAADPSPAAAIAAWGALGITTGDMTIGSSGSLVPAIAGLGAAQAALRLEWPQPTGATSLIAAAALAVVAGSASRRIPAAHRRRVAVALGLAGVSALVFSGILAGSALAARASVHRGIAETRAALDASRHGDTVEAERAFGRARHAFADAHALVAGWWTAPTRMIPVVATYRNASAELTATGADLAAAGARLARTSDPNITLKQGHISIPALRALEPALADASHALEQAARRLHAIESPWLIPKLTNDVREFERRVARGHDDVRTGQEAMGVVPALLGGDSTRRYFVAFQTPAEQRAAGGIIGNYAVVTFADGRFDLAQRGRDTDLNTNGLQEREVVGPADYVRRYSQFDPAHTWQNVTMSPDFPSVAQVVEHLAPQSGTPRVDGVVTLDPKAIAAILHLTGPVRVSKVAVTLTEANAEEFLLRSQYATFDSNGVRIDFLGEAIDAIIDRLKTVTLPPPSKIAEVLGPVVSEGRLALHSIRPEEQHFFARIGADGAFPAVAGDFAGLVTQNASGNKIDVFQRRSLHEDVVVNPDTGAVAATATITLHNDAPRTGLPHIVIGGSGPNPTSDGESRVYVSFYSPLALESATANGAPATIDQSVELNRHVYSTLVVVPPHAAVRLVLRLAGTVELRDAHGARAYQLTVWRQPTIAPDGIEINVRASRGDLAPAAGLQRNGTTLRAAGKPATTMTYIAIVPH